MAPMRPRAWLIASLVALAALAIVAPSIPAATWTEHFTHSLRTERLGHVAPSTEAAGRLVRVAWPLLAIALAALVVLLDRLSPNAPAPVNVPPARTRVDLWTLAALIVVAAIVRAPRMIESLWFDEIATLLDYAQFGPGPIVANAFTQANHTFHTLLTWLSMTAFGGVDELILRVPAFIASIATVPAMWWLARETMPQRRVVATLAAATVAIMPVVVLSGVEARGYSMMILFAALSIAALLRARRTGRPIDFALYALCAALGVWAHLVTVCLPLAHGAVALWWLRDSNTRRVGIATSLALGIAALLTLVLIMPMVPDMLAMRREYLALDGDEPTVWGAEGVHALLQLGGAWVWWAALPGLALAAAGTATLSRTAAGRVVLVSALLGGAIAVTLTTVGNSWLYARFLLFMVPTAALAMAVGIDRIRESRAATPGNSGMAAGMATAAAAFVVAGAWLTDLALRPPKQPLRDAVAVVAAARQPHQRVATIGLPDNVIAYYGQSHDLEIHPTGPLGIALGPALATIRPHWMIVLYPRSIPRERIELLRAAGFTEHTRLAGWADWGNGEVVIWHRAE